MFLSPLLWWLSPNTYLIVVLHVPQVPLFLSSVQSICLNGQSEGRYTQQVKRLEAKCHACCKPRTNAHATALAMKVCPIQDPRLCLYRGHSDGP